MSLHGNTRDFPLDVLLRLLADTKKTGELSLRGATGQGTLGVVDGHVVAAAFGDEPPVPALGAIFDLGPADFEFAPQEEAPAANLEGDLDELLRKAEEHRRWLASVREVIPDDRMRFRLSERAADRGAVTFTAERWRVVPAVNGQRDVGDLAAHLGIDPYAALDLLAGLIRDGVIDTVEPAAEATSPWAAEPEPAAATFAEPQPPPAPQTWSVTEPVAPAEPAPSVAEPGPADEHPSAWGVPPAADPWAPAVPATPDETEPRAAVDDRLAALFGSVPATPSAPAPAAPAPAAPDQWTSPTTDRWAPAPEAAWSPAQPVTPAPVEDPRLAAMSAPPVAEPPVADVPAEPAAPSVNEWAPPPAAEAPQKKGLFGLFHRDQAAPEPATQTTLVDRSAASRAGLLAAFSNALLTEYNSGHYGKNRIDDRMSGLLMRVDEQADPIDRPLPVVDDRLDVQALERTKIADAQSAPYLATLVATIYADAEQAFGRDKAKRGYRAAQQYVFGGDLSSLAAPDVAGKLPKV